METTKFLKTIIFLLVLINLGTVLFLWINRPQPKDNFGGFFAKELNFTAQQKEQFEVLRDEHRTQRESLKEFNKLNHDAYFDLLKNPNIDYATVKKAAQEIAAIKEQEELLVFYHFKKVRAICNEDQKQKFDKIVNEASQMMAPRPPRDGNGPPSRRGEDGPPPRR
jgi:Spy/CpxP family protein refolding chaperone